MHHGDSIDMRGADALVRTLRDHGVETVFGMCGHGDLAYLDAMAEQRVNFISVHHEQVAVHAADAYYRVTGKVGVVITTVASGMLNTLSGLADAYADSSAVVVISGLVPSRYAGLGAYQEIDLNGDDEQWLVSRPVVKRTFKVGDAQSLPATIARAFYEAQLGCPGPVHVHVPLDFSYTTSRYTRPAVLEPPRPALPPTVVSAVVDELRAAHRPVFYAGGGILNAGAGSLLCELANSLQTPVVTSMRAQGAIPQDDPMSLGFTGVVGSSPANYAVNHADLVIGIGTRFDEMDTSSWSEQGFLDPRRTKVVHLDIDARRIGRYFPVAVAGVADATMALEQLLAATAEEAWSRNEWWAELTPRVADWRQVLEKSFDPASRPLAPAAVITTVREASPPDAVVVAGVGARHLIAQQFPVLGGGALLTASGCGTMGWETGAVLGAAVATGSSGRPVIGILGDGAFNSTITALATAVANEVDAVWVILDNGGYQSIGVYQDRHFGRRIGTDFTYVSGERYQIDYVALAAAYGAAGETATTVDDVRAAIRRGLEGGGSYLVHVVTDPTTKANASGHWDVNDIAQGDFRRVPQPWRASDRASDSS